MLDALAALLRLALYAGLLFGAGAALACASLNRSGAPFLLKRTIRLGAIVALVATMASVLILLARLGGNLDAPTLSAVFEGPPGLSAALQVVGAGGLLIGAHLVGALATLIRLLGAIAALSSFAVNGHAAASGLVPALAALLHVALAAWWMGALLILANAARTSATSALSALLRRFTAQATILVISLGLAGSGLLAWLLDFSPPRLVSPYGAVFAAKLLVVSLLGLVVVFNRFRLAPRIARGDEVAVTGLRRTLHIELALILAVLAVTAILTTWTSPHS